MSLRTARSMGDISRTFLDIDHDNTRVSPPPLHNKDPSSLTDTQPTESDVDDDDSDDYFHYDFPQPPSITPALRRMHSSPWYSLQLEAMAKPERRHSVSPLIQHPAGWPQPLLRLNSQSLTIPVKEHSLGFTCKALASQDVPGRPGDDVRETHKQRPQPQRGALPSRRLDRLPPPLPAPSIPLPRLPRIIRKVASMRSESKQDLATPETSSKRPVPKIRSLKFMSGSVLNPSAMQPPKQEERKRGWSLSRPASFQKSRAVPTVEDIPYVTLNSTNDHLSDLAPWSRVPLAHASPAVYSNPCLPRSNAENQANGWTYEPDGHINLNRGGNTSLTPPFAHRTTRSNTSTSHRYSNVSCGESTLAGLGVRPGQAGSSVSYECPGSGLHPPSRSFYSVGNDGRGRSNGSGAHIQGAKSFINITPERRKSRRTKSGGDPIGAGRAVGGVGHQVGSAMKEKGDKMKKLLARASSGVIDWGRQLTGRSARSITASSTSGSLAPLTGMRS